MSDSFIRVMGLVFALFVTALFLRYKFGSKRHRIDWLKIFLFVVLFSIPIIVCGGLQDYDANYKVTEYQEAQVIDMRQGIDGGMEKWTIIVKYDTTIDAIDINPFYYYEIEIGDIVTLEHRNGKVFDVGGWELSPITFDEDAQ